jgi:hypothetical protein
MKRVLILAAAAAAAAIAAAVPADAGRYQFYHHQHWRTVGQTVVNGYDTDTVRLPGPARFRQLRLCVSGGPIHLRDLDVRFRNGGSQDVAVRDMIQGGTCTRNIDLRGNRRDVTAIRMKYAPLARHMMRPTVRIQAR